MVYTQGGDDTKDRTVTTCPLIIKRRDVEIRIWKGVVCFDLPGVYIFILFLTTFSKAEILEVKGNN